MNYWMTWQNPWYQNRWITISALVNNSTWQWQKLSISLVSQKPQGKMLFLNLLSCLLVWIIMKDVLSVDSQICKLQKKRMASTITLIFFYDDLGFKSYQNYLWKTTAPSVKANYGISILTSYSLVWSAIRKSLCIYVGRMRPQVKVENYDQMQLSPKDNNWNMKAISGTEEPR